MLDDGFSTSEVARRTGITARQLQWWDERGLVSPARLGRRRLYSITDLMDVVVIEELRKRGISLQQINRVVHFLRTRLRVRLAELVQDGQEHYLLLDENRIFLRTGSAEMIDLMKDARQPMFLVCLSDAARRLRLDVPQARRAVLGKSKAARKKAPLKKSSRRIKEVAAAS